MEEHLHSEGVRCPRQGGGAEYIINVIYYIYINRLRTYICYMVKKRKSFRKTSTCQQPTFKTAEIAFEVFLHIPKK